MERAITSLSQNLKMLRSELEDEMKGYKNKFGKEKINLGSTVRELQQQIKAKKFVLEQLVTSAKTKLRSSSKFSKAKRQEREQKLEAFFKNLPATQDEVIENLENIRKDLSKKLTEQEINDLCQTQNKLTELQKELENLQSKEKQLQAQIAKKIIYQVKPRILKELPKYSLNPDEQSANLVIEGDNLQALASLSKYRNKVDLILTDPPYNTGKDFRYIYVTPLNSDERNAKKQWGFGDFLVYGIQNPFTGEIQYPPPRSHWRRGKSRVKSVLEQWGSEYEERDLGDDRVSALVIKGSQAPYPENTDPLEIDPGRLAAKQYLKDVQKKVSGHSQTGSSELKSRVKTVEKFIGSGTAGESILQLNKIASTNRRFILIEKGNPNNGDNFCRDLLYPRLKATITGQ
ncbi:5991_t:CDS:2 [Scutellospora calospora]|uniref:5991_t:CDS:1 n=1 Tax=Scutellospora calospora TaxID=85575 RepID=A0ACA9JVA7_9GLOM|nr:5991_t:CDS:2 [Scutellospora calospora]